MIRSLIAALFLCVALLAQNPLEAVQKHYPELSLPIVSTSALPNGSLSNTYSNGMTAVFSVATDGSPVVTFLDQSPMPQDPVQMLTTSWVDAQGVTHTVSTPVISQTPAGVTRAREQHADTVKWLQGIHPPKPV
jgi:hypothetical protein